MKVGEDIVKEGRKSKKIGFLTFGLMRAFTTLESQKLGFSTIFSKYNKISLKNTVIKIELISKIEDLVGFIV